MYVLGGGVSVSMYVCLYVFVGRQKSKRRWIVQEVRGQ